ncbi:hypothetical protein PHPALM_29922 [Phytophthora palmivora]|uniref:Uncharacterized protein n=1 Tax=Phytophthora palmivora TaxID=4796 RepID=A0A2P4X6C0_9STRA|nr:hypothetical protein PHPALM_29922 [Phytophthora palmivora]
MAILDVSLRKDERFATIADAIAVVETFAEQTQQRHVRVQQPKPANTAEDVTPSPLSTNAVVLECENAPGCKWFVRLLFVKGEKKWKISSMSADHHKNHCVESKRSAAGSDALGFTTSMTTEQLLASANASAAAALAAASSEEAAAMDGTSCNGGESHANDVAWKECDGKKSGVSELPKFQL